MKSLISLSLFIILEFSGFGQNLSSDFVTTQVNKKVKEFPDRFDLSSPLMTAVTVWYISMNGKDGLWGKLSSLMDKYSFPDSTVKDSAVSQSVKEYFLNGIIKEYIVYKDSVACIITLQPDSSYEIRSVCLEKGRWLNLGDNGSNSLEASRNLFKRIANIELNQLRKFSSIKIFPTDTMSFINYLKTNGNDPLPFILKKLKTYKLVIYGEIHFRTSSWDFCTKLIQDPLFAENTGIIFMEMESNRQQQIDQFLLDTILNKELLLNIFRDYMPTGWDDKGRFDFLISLWYLNKKLPESRKIRVVFVDTPRIYTEEGLQNEIENRDGYMSEKVFETLETSQDPRHAFFIVGAGHVYRTEETAGAILYKKLKGNLYTVFTHCPVMDNRIQIPERIRNGMFDYAFYKNGDKPIAFELQKSPFGKEPFDGLYLDGSGSFQDNYDGYLFLGSIDEEKRPNTLYEMYDDKFIHEMARREHLMGRDLVKDWGLKELSVDAVLSVIKRDYTPLKWYYIKPLAPKK
ncbi:MAG: hypothetical protein ABSD71_13035 [Bacteroidales bacterium]